MARQNLVGGGNSRILVGSVRASYMHALWTAPDNMGGPASRIFGTPRSGDIRGDLSAVALCTETTNKTKRDHDVSIYPIRRPHRDGTHFIPSTTPRDSLMGSIQIIYALRFFQKSLVRNMKLVPDSAMMAYFTSKVGSTTRIRA